MLRCIPDGKIPNSNCKVFPPVSNFVCSKYLGNDYVYNVFDDWDTFAAVNRDIDDVGHIFKNLVVRRPFCSNLLMMLMCSAAFPRCLPSNNSMVKQTFCKETCSYIYSYFCNEFLVPVSRYFGNEKWRLRHDISRTLLNLNECKNYPSKYDHDGVECLSILDKDAIDNEQCHGNLDIYVGNISWTKSNKTCHKWSDTCNDTHLIDLTEMSGIETNFCRNPTGYRKGPWCFTDRTTKNWEYCDIPHCASVDGNYGEWSSFTNCSCENMTKIRTRSCDNPAPKYMGRNCSHLGPDIEVDYTSCNHLDCDPKLSNPLLFILIPAFFVAFVGGVVFLVQRRRRAKRDIIEPYVSVDLDPQKINELITFSHTNDEAEIIKSIKDHIMKFSHCLCSTCISNWLFTLIKNSGYKENDHLSDDIRLMLADLENIEGYHNLSRACHRTNTGNTHCSESHHLSPDDNETEKTSGSFEKYQKLSDAVDKWVKNQIVYDKLNPCTRTTDHIDEEHKHPRLLFGSFEICGSKIVPLYDKLKKQRGKDPHEASYDIIGESSDDLNDIPLANCDGEPSYNLSLPTYCSIPMDVSISPYEDSILK